MYEEIANELGFDVAEKIFNNYKGLQITFPNKFRNSQYIHSKILDEYAKGASIQELVRKYNYSERYVRMLLRKNNNN